MREKIKDNKLESQAVINQSIIFSKFSSLDRRKRKSIKQPRTNFITYAKRAKSIINNPAIEKQIIFNHKKVIRKKIAKALNMNLQDDQ